MYSSATHHYPDTPLAMFLGNTPVWYKKAVLAALVLNVVFYFTLGTLLTSWIILFEFIFTLAMALKCFPLPARNPTGYLHGGRCAFPQRDAVYVHEQGATGHQVPSGNECHHHYRRRSNVRLPR